MADQPLGHLVRPNPPWHHEQVTECGRSVADVARITTPAEVKALVAEHGKQRAAFTTCMTCANTWQRRAVSADVADAWPTDPGGVLHRILTGTSYRLEDPTTARIRLELLALGMLYDNHRDEFDALMAGLTEAPTLAGARRARSARAARAANRGGPR